MPTKDQISLARRITEGENKSKKRLTDDEIRERMETLQNIHKGTGHPMYESLKTILLERSMTVQKI